MRAILFLALAILFTQSAIAKTYEFDFNIGSSFPNGVLQDGETGASLDGDVNVTGFVETDGSLGAIDDTSILNWQFTLSALGETYTMSSAGTLSEAPFASGPPPDVTGEFFATDTTLRANGEFMFTESVYFDQQVGGNTIDYLEIGLMQFGLGEMTFAFADLAVCSNTACTSFVSDGFSGGNTPAPGGEFVGYAISEVPLPAALPMLLFGLGGLAFIGRRRSI